MNMIKSSAVLRDQGFLSVMAGARQGVVVVVSDDPALGDRLEPVCTFLELRPECVTSGMDLLDALQQEEPIAVIGDIECEAQDGFHTMKVVADYHRDLPVFMMTEGDPILMGATDASHEICGLTTVTRSTGAPLAGELVSFLFSAGRRAGCIRLVPI